MLNEKLVLNSIKAEDWPVITKAITIMLETGDWEKIPVVDTTIYVRAVHYKTKLPIITIKRYINFAMNKLIGKEYNRIQEQLKKNLYSINK
jgi:hypothetical protein